MTTKDPHWLDKVVEILTAETVDLAELAFIAGIPVEQLQTNLASQSSVSILPSIELEEQVLELKKFKTQNFRFSGAVKLTIENPESASFIVRLIDEKTNIGLRALNSFSETFTSLWSLYHNENQNDTNTINKAALFATDKALKTIYHMNRGRFIFALASDLGALSEFNSYLRSKLKPTLAMAVYLRAIEAELDRWQF